MNSNSYLVDATLMQALRCIQEIQDLQRGTAGGPDIEHIGHADACLRVVATRRGLLNRDTAEQSRIRALESLNGDA